MQMGVETKAIDLIMELKEGLDLPNQIACVIFSMAPWKQKQQHQKGISKSSQANQWAKKHYEGKDIEIIRVMRKVPAKVG